MKTNYENDQLPLSKQEVIEEIITNQYYLVDAFRKDNKEEIVRRHLMVQELIDTYLNRTKNEL